LQKIEHVNILYKLSTESIFVHRKKQQFVARHAASVFCLGGNKEVYGHVFTQSQPVTTQDRLTQKARKFSQ